VAARGIHVQDIAHVINYDLPEVAENFIHRVGRTGRAGECGVASTLFVREQRTELFQLERALGIRIERVSMNGDSFEKRARACRPGIGRIPATSGPRMVRLPGEFLQAQMEG
jgi:superfamily II DNA/RNA helicase